MKQVLTVLGISAFAMSLAACNTMHGMGQDISRGGQKLESSASGASSGSSSNSSKSEQQRANEQQQRDNTQK